MLDDSKEYVPILTEIEFGYIQQLINSIYSDIETTLEYLKVRENELDSHLYGLLNNQLVRLTDTSIEGTLTSSNATFWIAMELYLSKV